MLLIICLLFASDGFEKNGFGSMKKNFTTKVDMSKNSSVLCSATATDVDE